VDAALISRSGAPEWRPAALADVPPAAVQRFFDPLAPEGELPLEGVQPRSKL
jgi:hypothetical protein